MTGPPTIIGKYPMYPWKTQNESLFWYAMITIKKYWNIETFFGTHLWSFRK